MRNAPPDSGRIQHMAHIHDEDRQDHNPRRGMVAEQINPDQLRSPGVNRQTHQRSLPNRQTLINRNRAIQQAERRSGNQDRDGALGPGEELGGHGLNAFKRNASIAVQPFTVR